MERIGWWDTHSRPQNYRRIYPRCAANSVFVAYQALEMFDDAEEFFGRLPESFYGKFIRYF